MKRTIRGTVLAAALILTSTLTAGAQTSSPVQTANGLVAGTVAPGGLRAYRGIPFAAPPVDDLRWREPQPVKSWTGVRQANRFGPRCMQQPIYSDMVFRSAGVSEDCLYLNVWTPARSASERLPVLVYFYGGGFMAGDGSEPRYDGASMARKGIVSLTVNYRLGVFGFLAHPELTRESPNHASGNYAFLDQAAALRWVRENIAAFGGDPNRVTIAGESAGSIAVSALMASPLSRGLIAGAIGESGGQMAPTLPPAPLATGEENGTRFMTSVGASSIAAMRALSSQEVLDAASRPGAGRFGAVVDGYFLPKPTVDIYAAGEQAHVPLLIGWNSEESGARGVLGNDPATPAGYAAAVRRLYGDRADEVLRLYPGSTDDEVRQSATDLAGDRFIAFSTWKWAELAGKTGGKPVFRYYYTRPRPAPVAPAGRGDSATPPAPARGAVHSAEIEYAMGNLDTNPAYAWTDEDRRVSTIMQGYFANFVKTGTPNGAGLPAWPAANAGNTIQVMHLDVEARVEPDRKRDRYLFLDQLYSAEGSR
jgi:para-nitrobenzyl esterase